MGRQDRGFETDLCVRGVGVRERGMVYDASGVGRIWEGLHGGL